MEQLTDILANQISGYDSLIALSEIKKDIIVSNDAEALQKITSEENAVVGRVQKLDKNRLAVMNEIAIVLNIQNPDYTLSDLCELIKEQDEYNLLVDLTNDTREKLIKLKAINTQNKVLIENSLEYIEYSVNVMRSSLEPNKSFYNTAGEQIVPGTGFFDVRQ
jgi:flagellar biosynthesis/type III secretory pathway chaperone